MRSTFLFKEYKREREREKEREIEIDREREREREREKQTNICGLRLHIIIFTIIYYDIYDMRERERERTGGKTNIYYLI